MVDVAVNPKFHEWSSGCIDGHVRTFRHTSFKSKGNSVKAGKPPGGVVEKPNSIKT